jgi:hypothetical protein
MSYSPLKDIPKADFLLGLVTEDIPLTEAMKMSSFRKKEINGELQPEPLLKEDKGRFVLFPIKHNDVSIVCLGLPCISVYLIFVFIENRFGRCTRKLRLPFGQRKKST